MKKEKSSLTFNKDVDSLQNESRLSYISSNLNQKINNMNFLQEKCELQNYSKKKIFPLKKKK